jgi:hypothetical protein
LPNKELVIMAHNTPEDEAAAAAVPAGQHQEIFDLDVSYVRWFSLGVVLLVIVTAAAAFGMLGGFRVPHAPAAAPAAEESSRASFATLQSAPQDELRAFRRGKSAELEGYRWVDRASGVVQIPIERAMELMAAEGRTP